MINKWLASLLSVSFNCRVSTSSKFEAVLNQTATLTMRNPLIKNMVLDIQIHNYAGEPFSMKLASSFMLPFRPRFALQRMR